MISAPRLGGLLVLSLLSAISTHAQSTLTFSAYQPLRGGFGSDGANGPTGAPGSAGGQGGTLTITGGTTNITNSLDLSGGSGGNGGYGELASDGIGQGQGGDGGKGGNGGALVVSGGTVNVTEPLFLAGGDGGRGGSAYGQGGDGGAAGTITVTAGAANFTQSVNLSGGHAGDSAPGTPPLGRDHPGGNFTLSGGSADFAAGSSLNLSGGYMSFSTSDAGTLALSGGTLRLTHAGWLENTETFFGNFSFTGGTLTTTSSGESLVLAGGSILGIALGNTGVSAPRTLDLAGNLAFSGVIAGTGSLTKSGSGILTLSGANTYTGGTTISAGTLVLGTGGAITGNLTNHAALVFDRTDTATFAGIISGSGSLTKNGSGTVLLSGAHTYTGGTAINAGTLILGTGSSLVGPIVNNAALVLDRTDTSTFANALSGSGSLTKSGSGTVMLSAAHTFTGGTTINAGSLGLADGGSLVGSITNNANLAFNRTDTSTFANATSGSGSLTKTGSGTVTLTGAHTHTGGTTINAGILTLGTGGSLAGNIVNHSVFAFDRTDTSSFSGTISGSGSLTKNGSGTVLLSGAHTYTGGTTINAGTLAASSSVGSVGTFAGGSTVTVNAGGTLEFRNSNALGYYEGNARLVVNGGTVNNAYGSNVTLQDVTMTGGTLTSTAGGGAYFLNGLLVTSAAPTTAVINAPNLNLGTGWASGPAASFTIARGTAPSGIDLSITSAINGLTGGPAALIKNGPGTLQLTGANTYANGTTLNAGTLVANNTAGSATGSGPVAVNTGATLGGSGLITGLTTFASGAHLAPGNSPGTLTFTGGLALLAGSNLDFELGSTSDLIRVSGGTLTGPTSGFITLNLTNSGGFTAGTYTLFDFTSAATSSFEPTDFAFGTTIPGYTYALALAGSTLQLTATASAIPEPSTYAALFGAVALALAAYRRRKK